MDRRAPDDSDMTRLAQYIEAAERDNTRRSYASAIWHFEIEWKGLLPSTADAVSRYLADHAATLAMNTLRQRLAALSRWHTDQGFADPTYVDRLLKKELEEHANDMRRMREKMLASTGSIFDQVRKSSSALGSTLTEFERLTKRSAHVEIHAPNMDHFHAMNEQFARQARERAEELEMVRLTGKMTADSAKTLKDLAEAATVLLERLDERDEKADKSTRTQINIAV